MAETFTEGAATGSVTRGRLAALSLLVAAGMEPVTALRREF